MAPQEDASVPPQPATPFSQLLARMQSKAKDTDAR
jgi:hypothetical protein